jgi:hypothetical protein
MAWPMWRCQSVQTGGWQRCGDLQFNELPLAARHPGAPPEHPLCVILPCLRSPTLARCCLLLCLPSWLQEWVAQLGYKDLVTFTSTDAPGGGTVYHTNVMMAIGTGGLR